MTTPPVGFKSLRRAVIRNLADVAPFFALPFALALGGFLCFLWTMRTAELNAAGRGDVIVVFSGDPARVQRGVELLAGGRGRRLLVAGLDNADEIARQKASHGQLFACCVDVHDASRTTREDAAATRDWLARQDVRSVLLVTSSDHVPRSLLELRHELPEVELDAVAVVTGLVDWRRWWTEPKLWQRLLKEYVKCIGAGFRNLLLGRAFPRPPSAPGASRSQAPA